MCDLVPFAQFKKRDKHWWRTVTFSKVAGWGVLEKCNNFSTNLSVKLTNYSMQPKHLKPKPYLHWFAINSYLIISWRRSLSYRDQSTGLLFKSMNWFLFDRGPCHERINASIQSTHGLLMKFVVAIYFKVVQINDLNNQTGNTFKQWMAFNWLIFFLN